MNGGLTLRHSKGGSLTTPRLPRVYCLTIRGRSPRFSAHHRKACPRKVRIVGFSRTGRHGQVGVAACNPGYAKSANGLRHDAHLPSNPARTAMRRDPGQRSGYRQYHRDRHVSARGVLMRCVSGAPPFGFGRLSQRAAGSTAGISDLASRLARIGIVVRVSLGKTSDQ